MWKTAFQVMNAVTLIHSICEILEYMLHLQCCNLYHTSGHFVL